MLTGICLSLCVRDIIRGKVKLSDVKVIVHATAFKNVEDWDETLKVYMENFWQESPKKGVRIARKLIRSGKVVQPRLQGKKAPRVDCSGWWLNEKGNLVLFQ